MINATKDDVTLDLFRVFVWVYTIYIQLNFFFYVERWGFSLIGILPVAFSFFLIFRPTSSVLFLTALFSTTQSLYYFPSTSNSIIIAVILNLILIGGYFHSCLAHKTLIPSASSFYTAFAPAGRGLLLTMYFWGTFHKINTGFLDPEMSYAIVLLRAFWFFPSTVTDSLLVQYLFIYGTLVLESSLILMLLYERTRYLGVALGVAFHMLISVNQYRNYIYFSCLAFCLHTLFLSPQIMMHYRNSRLGAAIVKYTGDHGTKVFGVVAILLMFGAYSSMEFDTFLALFKVCWVPVGLMICAFMVCYDYRKADLSILTGYYLFSPSRGLNIFVGLFFLSCASNYIGLKNEQTMAMFSNLKTEAGVSNHLIVQRPFYMFDYLAHPVKIISTTNPELKEFEFASYQISSFVMEYHMARAPETSIKYMQNGLTHDYPNGIPPELQEKWKKPYLLYKIMSFRGIDTEGRSF